MGSPLTVALAWRGVARFSLGRDGWRQDLDDAVAMARSTDPVTLAVVLTWNYGFGITNGVLLADDSAVRELDEALQVAERSGDDYMLGLAHVHAGFRAGASGRRRRPAARTGAAGAGPRHVPARAVLPKRITGLRVCRRAVRGPGAATAMVPSADAQRRQRRVADRNARVGRDRHRRLVELLLDRGTEGDVAEAQSAIDRAANVPADEGLVLRDVIAAAAARAAGPGPRRRSCLPRLGESLSRDGGITWLRRTHRHGENDDDVSSRVETQMSLARNS